MDVYEPDLAAEIERLVVEHLGTTPLRRVGQAPKALLVYRAADGPISKAMTDVLWKDGVKAQVEVLGQGQQFVAAGIHPVTREPNTWGDATPDNTPLAEMPAVTQEQVKALITAAEIRIRAAGYSTKAEIEAESAPPVASRANLKGKVAAAGISPFRTVNDAALAAPDRWVPNLFGAGAREDSRGVWRVSSSSLGRDREEDIGIAANGIVDFGEHDMGDPKRGKRTAIDLVIEHGGAADAKAAARWLADLLGLEIEIGRQEKPRLKSPEPEIDPEADRWNEQLHRNDRGEARDIIHNVTLILRTDTRFKGHIRYNELLEAVEAQGLPWRGGEWVAWTDADDIYLAQWCQQRHCYVKRPTCAAAVQIVARDLMHHPVRQRLNAVTWDGNTRIGTWLTDYLGVQATAFAGEVGMRWLISAVARVFRPGVKVDYCLILEGPQGARKSTAAATIALEDAWFSDEIADLGSKDAAQDLRGKWIVELGELSAIRRGESERTKAFMSRRVDHYRPSYGSRSQDFPRQCVFVGTTNSDSYLADETGARRFWPVKVGAIDIAKLIVDRDQLWAEAVAAYHAGAIWWLDAETEIAARETQAERRIVDPWEQAVMVWAKAQIGGLTVQEALANAITMDLDRVTQNDSSRVARIFKFHGWERKQARIAGTRVWQYHRPPEAPEPTPAEVAAEQRATAFRRAAASPVSPVSASQGGDGNPSNSAPVTSVTSGFQTHTGASPTPHWLALQE